jgi:hypothetical protein
MSEEAAIGQSGGGRSEAAPAVPVPALLAAGLILGVLGDGLLRAPGPPGLNMLLWVASVAVAAVVLSRRMGVALDRERVCWLALAVLFAAGPAWRDSPALKLFALGCATLAFALAAYRIGAAWVRTAEVLRYVQAWGTGALHAWLASFRVMMEASRSQRQEDRREAGSRPAAAVARGLLLSTPLVLVFGALFMSADAMFEDLVLNLVRIDFNRLATHVMLFLGTAWVATGYLRGFLTGTELPPLRTLSPDSGLQTLVPKRLALGITEVATALATLDLLFLVFVILQFRYLFGGDALVQVTPDLTYAQYARRGFFELVVAVFLVVPVLLAADGILERRGRRDDLVFRGLAGVQIVLMLAIAASAFQRLRLYHVTYGLTELRFYAMVGLIWIAAMLVWLAATVLRGRPEAFAFGALASGLATLTLLFVLNPDAIIARTNVARMSAADARVRFDVAYATSLSADAVPMLIDALPGLPPDVQCPLARHMLRSWPPDHELDIRAWSWAASGASDAVRQHELQLRSMIGPDQKCPTPPSPAPPA